MRGLIKYQWHTGKLKKSIKIAVVSDLHDEEYEDIWSLIKGADCLLVPGDIANRYRQRYECGVAFLEEAAERMPTFFSVGNHEIRLKKRAALLERLEKSKATVLFNRYVRFGEIWIGGWYQPEICRMEDMMDEFEALPGCKVLMCHRPEDYMRKLRRRDVDLVLAGHAHGGQIRYKNQGIYSPGQGLFPAYTKGVTGGRMIVSAGAGNPIGLPRWGNPCEVLQIELD